MSVLARSPFAGPRRVIDVSGDGTNNSGRPVTAARDAGHRPGITINGLVILSEVHCPPTRCTRIRPAVSTAYYENT